MIVYGKWTPFWLTKNNTKYLEDTLPHLCILNKKCTQFLKNVVSIPSPLVPLQVPSLSLYLLASLSTKKDEHVAWAFSLENVCKSILSIYFPSLVREWIASLPRIALKNYQGEGSRDLNRKIFFFAWISRQWY